MSSLFISLFTRSLMFCYFSTEQQKPQAKKPRRQNKHIQAKEQKKTKTIPKIRKPQKNTRAKTPDWKEKQKLLNTSTPPNESPCKR